MGNLIVFSIMMAFIAIILTVNEIIDFQLRKKLIKKLERKFNIAPEKTEIKGVKNENF